MRFDQARVNGGSNYGKSSLSKNDFANGSQTLLRYKRFFRCEFVLIRLAGSQMPRHLISDAHEWINEIPTVPIYYLAKPQPRERAWQI
jgi:hypothetical protein